jgi:phage/plasmid-like protein (TIGR03299 family)
VFFLLHGDTLDIGGRGDIVHQYALLANAHDGTMSATILPTSVRVVCNNTLTAALGKGATGAYRWRHTSGLALKVDDIKAALAAYGKVAETEAAAMTALAAKSLTRSEIQSLWTDVLVALDGPIAVNPKDDRQARRKAKAVEELAYMARVFDRESAQFGATAWVAANAATHLIQHERGQLRGEARQQADLLGAYAEAKRTVMQTTLALL